MATHHIMSSYFAPRGKDRMYTLGQQIAQLYLSPFDRLIGVIGNAGSGKSALIKGMFPGMELTNDDDGVNVRPLPILDQDFEDNNNPFFFSPHTYHLDIRFETGFSQMRILAEAVLKAVNRGKRVIIEHFELIYPLLNMNADLLIGVGEEVTVARPTLFGPMPEEIKELAYGSLPFRLMSHTAEDLCEYFMPASELKRCKHGDVRHGFTMIFPDHAPDFDLKELEMKVQNMIDQNLPITYHDARHISIGENILHSCNGPRTHVRNTREIECFHLLDHFVYDSFDNTYLLVGGVGKGSGAELKKLVEGFILDPITDSYTKLTGLNSDMGMAMMDPDSIIF